MQSILDPWALGPKLGLLEQTRLPYPSRGSQHTYVQGVQGVCPGSCFKLGLSCPSPASLMKALIFATHNKPRLGLE